jgi:hypothetical protein
MQHMTFDPMTLARAAMRGFLPGGVAPTGVDGVVDTPVRILEASAATCVLLIGPYEDPVLGGVAVTLLEARIQGDTVVGRYVTRPGSGERGAVGSGTKRGMLKAMAA